MKIKKNIWQNDSVIFYQKSRTSVRYLTMRAGTNRNVGTGPHQFLAGKLTPLPLQTKGAILGNTKIFGIPAPLIIKVVQFKV